MTTEESEPAFYEGHNHGDEVRQNKSANSKVKPVPFENRPLMPDKKYAPTAAPK